MPPSFGINGSSRAIARAVAQRSRAAAQNESSPHFGIQAALRHVGYSPAAALSLTENQLELARRLAAQATDLGAQHSAALAVPATPGPIPLRETPGSSPWLAESHGPEPFAFYRGLSVPPSELAPDFPLIAGQYHRDSVWATTNYSFAADWATRYGCGEGTILKLHLPWEIGSLVELEKRTLRELHPYIEEVQAVNSSRRVLTGAETFDDWLKKAEA